MPTGHIASEVVEALRKEPIPVAPAVPMPITQAVGEPPLETRVTNLATPWSGRWWFEKAGPTGIVCFLLIGVVGWMMNSQASSLSQVFEMVNHDRDNSAKDRQALLQIILNSNQSMLNSQAEITNNLSRTARILERIEAKMDKNGKIDE